MAEWIPFELGNVPPMKMRVVRCFCDPTDFADPESPAYASGHYDEYFYDPQLYSRVIICESLQTRDLYPVASNEGADHVSGSAALAKGGKYHTVLKPRNTWLTCGVGTLKSTMGVTLWEGGINGSGGCLADGDSILIGGELKTVGTGQNDHFKLRNVSGAYCIKKYIEDYYVGAGGQEAAGPAGHDGHWQAIAQYADRVGVNPDGTPKYGVLYGEPGVKMGSISPIYPTYRSGDIIDVAALASTATILGSPFYNISGNDIGSGDYVHGGLTSTGDAMGTGITNIYCDSGHAGGWQNYASIGNTETSAIPPPAPPQGWNWGGPVEDPNWNAGYVYHKGDAVVKICDVVDPDTSGISKVPKYFVSQVNDNYGGFAQTPNPYQTHLPRQTPGIPADIT